MISSNLHEVISNVSFKYEELEKSELFVLKLDMFIDEEAEMFDAYEIYVKQKLKGLSDFLCDMNHDFNFKNIYSGLYFLEEYEKEILKEAEWFTELEYDKYITHLIQNRSLVRLTSNEVKNDYEQAYFTSFVYDNFLATNLLSLPWLVPFNSLMGFLIFSSNDMFLICSEQKIYFYSENKKSIETIKNLVSQEEKNQVPFVKG